MPESHNLSTRSHIKGFALLEELALNLRWSWNHLADKVWQQLDANLLYANRTSEYSPIYHEMKCQHPHPDDSAISIYKALVISRYSPLEYTPRVIPYFKNVSIPLETNQILWQR